MKNIFQKIIFIVCPLLCNTLNAQSIVPLPNLPDSFTYNIYDFPKIGKYDSILNILSYNDFLVEINIKDTPTVMNFKNIFDSSYKTRGYVESFSNSFGFYTKMTDHSWFFEIDSKGTKAIGWYDWFLPQFFTPLTGKLDHALRDYILFEPKNISYYDSSEINFPIISLAHIGKPYDSIRIDSKIYIDIKSYGTGKMKLENKLFEVLVSEAKSAAKFTYNRKDSLGDWYFLMDNVVIDKFLRFFPISSLVALVTIRNEIFTFVLSEPHRAIGIEDLQSGEEILIYPNPIVDGVFYAEFPDYKEYKFKISNLQGNQYYLENLSSINKVDLPNGIYFLNIFDQNMEYLFSRKLVILH